VGGVIAQYLSWHWIFLINLPIGAACALLSNINMAKSDTSKTKFDWAGYFLFSSAVILLTLSLGSAGETRIDRNCSIAMFMAGLLCLALDARFAIARPYRALFKPRLFYERSFSVGILANLLLRLGMGAVPFLIPLFLQTALGYSPSKAGLAMLPLGITTIVAKTFVETALNAFGYRKFMIYNTVIIGAMLCLIALMNASTPFWALLTFLGAMGIFNSMHFTALNTLALIAVPKRDLSQANGLLSSVMQLAMSLGVAVVSAVLAYFAARADKTGADNIVSSFHAAFLFIGVFTIASSALFISRVSKGIVDRPKNIK
jgi:predicted MFS family arabinose efflux permease